MVNAYIYHFVDRINCLKFSSVNHLSLAFLLFTYWISVCSVWVVPVSFTSHSFFGPFADFFSSIVPLNVECWYYCHCVTITAIAVSVLFCLVFSCSFFHLYSFSSSLLSSFFSSSFLCVRYVQFRSVCFMLPWIQIWVYSPTPKLSNSKVDSMFLYCVFFSSLTFFTSTTRENGNDIARFYLPYTKHHASKTNTDR